MSGVGVSLWGLPFLGCGGLVAGVFMKFQPLTAKYVAAHSFTSVELTPTTFVLRQITSAGKEVDHIKITQ